MSLHFGHIEIFGKVAGRGRAVLDLHRGDRLRTGANAIEEVLHVGMGRVRRLATRTGAPRIRGQRIVGQLFRRFAVHAAAVDVQFALIADERGSRRDLSLRH